MIKRRFSASYEWLMLGVKLHYFSTYCGFVDDLQYNKLYSKSAITNPQLVELVEINLETLQLFYVFACFVFLKFFFSLY